MSVNHPAILPSWSTHPHRKMKGHHIEGIDKDAGIGESPRVSRCFANEEGGSIFVKMSAGISEVEIQEVEKDPSSIWERMK